jgi:hypothetical protein
MEMHHEDGEPASSSLAAGVTFVAASYQTMDYGGDYQGVVPSASWALGRFSVGASWAYYRLFENGAHQRGVGDAVVHGHAALLVRDDVQAGVMLAASAPTGDDVVGLGMGHVMLMPAGWGAWRFARVVVTGSFGYSRALVDASSHHDHGAWPLVEPMNMSELTWSGGGELALGAGVRAGVRLSGGVPIGALPGHERVVGTLRAAWGQRRVETAAELQAGLAGDPFTVRGVLSAALRF